MYKGKLHRNLRLNVEHIPDSNLGDIEEEEESREVLISSHDGFRSDDTDHEPVSKYTCTRDLKPSSHVICSQSVSVLASYAAVPRKFLTRHQEHWCGVGQAPHAEFFKNVEALSIILMLRNIQIGFCKAIFDLVGLKSLVESGLQCRTSSLHFSLSALRIMSQEKTKARLRD